MKDTDLSPAGFARRQVGEAADLMADLRRKLLAATNESERADLRTQLQNARTLLRRYAEAEVIASGRELADLTTPPSAWQPAKTTGFGAIDHSRPIQLHTNWRNR
jgi:hypothetical protein